MKATKQNLYVFQGEKDEPKAVIHYSKERRRVIYLLEEATDEQIVELLEHKDKIIQTNADTKR